MNVSWRNAVLILAGWPLVNMAWAQTDDARAVLTRLSINQVAELDGHVYARVQDQRRGGTQALERLLIGRATCPASRACMSTSLRWPKAREVVEAAWLALDHMPAPAVRPLLQPAATCSRRS